MYLDDVVDVEGQFLRGEVEQDADRVAHLDAALRAARVDVLVHQPGALAVNVHAPALVVLP